MSFCHPSAVQTLASALTALGLINKVDLDGFDPTVQLVGKPVAAASGDAEDKGRLFVSCGGGNVLFHFPRVAVDSAGCHFYTNSAFAVLIEPRKKQNPGYQPYTDLHLSLALTG
jgi:hypothetical protein